jgi:hypothetical protein
MKTEGNIGPLFAALAKASAELASITRDSRVDTGRYQHSFASLDAILATVKPVLAKHGLVIIQCPSYSDGLVAIETTIAHVEGGHISSTLSIPVAQATPQAVGSAVSYARRYSLRAMLSLSEDDDDGQEAARPAPRPLAKPVDQATSAKLAAGYVERLSGPLTRADIEEIGEEIAGRASEMTRDDLNRVRAKYSPIYQTRFERA